MPLEEPHLSQVPHLQAPECPQPFNEAEFKVAGIMPYTYGMPRYGQVSEPLMRRSEGMSAADEQECMLTLCFYAQQPFRPEGGDMTNKLNPYGRGFPYGFYKTVL